MAGPKDKDHVPDEVAPGTEVSEGVRALVGFVGKSERADEIRLYITPSFDNYFEIPRDAIVKTKKFGDDSSVGGTVVWVRKTARIGQVKMRNFEIEAEYLRFLEAARQVTFLGRICDPDPCEKAPRPGAADAPGSSVFLCGSTSWFLAAPDLPNPWSTSDCNSSTYGDFCTWTAEC